MSVEPIAIHSPETQVSKVCFANPFASASISSFPDSCLAASPAFLHSSIESQKENLGNGRCARYWSGARGVVAALRAAYLGKRTTLVTRDEFGGMAANDGPVPVRTLAHAARLFREARQLGQYGIAVREPALDYPRLLEGVREVVQDVLRTHLSVIFWTAVG